MNGDLTLPNLKISVENDGPKADSHENSDVDESDESDESLGDYNSVEDNTRVIIVPGTLSKYLNPLNPYNEDIDLNHVHDKLSTRASRFGIEVDEEIKKSRNITEDDIAKLYKDLDLDEIEMENGFIRFDALHVRGVQDMSTEDVFQFFKQFFPASIQWINDVSCNVCWAHKDPAARAMITLGTKTVNNIKSTEKFTKEDKMEDENSSIVDKTDQTENITKTCTEAADTIGEKLMDNDDVVMAVDEDDNEFDKTDLTNDEDIQPEEDKSNSNPDDFIIPPGYWKLGMVRDKAKPLLMRFATKDDVKSKGAEKRSQYYRKHGNPNYNGLPGLISNSRKRKIRSKPQDLKQKLSSNIVPEEIESEGSEEEYSSSKIPRSNMYADIEQSRKKKMLELKVTTKAEADVEDKVDLREKLNNMKRKRTSAFDRLSYSTPKPNELSSDEGKLSSDCDSDSMFDTKPAISSQLGHISRNQHRSPLLRDE